MYVSKHGPYLTIANEVSGDHVEGTFCDRGRDDNLFPIYLLPLYPLTESRGAGACPSCLRASERVHPGQVTSLSQGYHVETTNRPHTITIHTNSAFLQWCNSANYEHQHDAALICFIRVAWPVLSKDNRGVC